MFDARCVDQARRRAVARRRRFRSPRPRQRFDTIHLFEQFVATRVIDRKGLLRSLGRAARPRGRRGSRSSSVLALVACRSESKPQPAPAPQAASKPSHKPPDEMDEKMRHCPLARDGAASKLEDIDDGVRFTIVVPEASIDELRRRAHRIIEFAAKRTREGHGEFDGKGGGRMKNCPVVTDGVTISAADVPGGATLDVVASPITCNNSAQSRASARRSSRSSARRSRSPRTTGPA